jgi:hypothetical protein
VIATPQRPAEAGCVQPPEFTLEIGLLHAVWLGPRSDQVRNMSVLR